MDRLEESLKNALARKAPPPSFEDRLATCAARGQIARSSATRWLAAAAAIVIAVGSGVAYRQHEGAVAKEQVMTAMRITAVKLNRIQAHVLEGRQ